MNLNSGRIGVDRSAEGLSPGSPTATLAEGPAAIAAPIHSYFKREAGPLVRAQLHFGQYSQLPRSASLASQRGVRYEKKVLRLLAQRFGDRLLPGPLFTFVSRNGSSQRCYPDALLFSEDWSTLCVLEVKYRHTGDAWWQLNRFYLPIIRLALPMFRVCAAEITASYDPAQRLPSPVAFVDSADEAFETREAFHCVYVLTERELKYDGSVA